MTFSIQKCPKKYLKVPNLMKRTISVGVAEGFFTTQVLSLNPSLMVSGYNMDPGSHNYTHISLKRQHIEIHRVRL